MKADRLRHCGAYLLTALILVGCGQQAPEIAISAPQVSIMTLEPAQMDLTEGLPGRVAAVRVAEIRAQVSGIVQHRLFEQGAEIRAGQPLFQINPAPFKADADMAAAALQRAEAALERARVQAERLQSLVEADAVSLQVYDDAVSQRDQAAADVAEARATLARRQLDLKFARVDAPIPGRIDQALVTEGALVGASDTQPMARIQQIDQVYVDVRQPASSLESFRAAFTARQARVGEGLPVTILRSNGVPYDLTGKILFSGINVDTGTGDVLLRVLVNNARRQLLPGMFVRARVPLARYSDALMVPQQAVMRAGDQASVWIVDEQNQAHAVPIELGELVNRRYRIRAGLSAGQRIVIEGLERLSEGLAVNTRAWSSNEIVTHTISR